MMFCTKCGKDLAEGVKFCTSCGTPVTSAEPISAGKTASSVLAVTDTQEGEPTFSFFKKKQFMGCVYKIIDTDIFVKNDKITFNTSHSSNVLRINKKLQNSQTFNLSDIQAASVSSSLEVWSIIAIVFNVLVFLFTFEFLLLIPFAFWLWYGYVKEIRILLANGQIIKIPFEGLAGQGEDADLLLALCNKQTVNS